MVSLYVYTCLLKKKYRRAEMRAFTMISAARTIYLLSM